MSSRGGRRAWSPRLYALLAGLASVTDLSGRVVLLESRALRASAYTHDQRCRWMDDVRLGQNLAAALLLVTLLGGAGAALSHLAGPWALFPWVLVVAASVVANFALAAHRPTPALAQTPQTRRRR